MYLAALLKAAESCLSISEKKSTSNIVSMMSNTIFSAY